MKMKINEIEALLKMQKPETLQAQLEAFKTDSRLGVQKLLKKYENQYNHYIKEKELWCLKEDFDAFFHEHQKVVVGIDEVGRGPLAGPVVAAAVILPYNVDLIGLKDSKKLTEAKREVLYDEIKKKALAIGIGQVEADEIDQINILQATFKAMREALSQIQTDYELVLVDGNQCIPKVPTLQKAIIGGDDKSARIAAASVIAKVTRDRLMKEEAKNYPGYGWEDNKGYGSPKHYEGIKKQGLTPLHRKTFLKNEGFN